MHTHSTKINNAKSNAIANVASKVNNTISSPLQFVDNRPEAVIQRKLQKASLNKTSKINNSITLSHNSNVSQLKVIQFGRPGFSGPAKKQRGATDSDDDLAHRISYHDIEQIILYGTQKQKDDLIKKVTIPQRKFAQYPKGYKGYYNSVLTITDAAYLIKALNNSPFNLRPGVASVNRSIGAGFDPNVDDSGYDTDQSEALRPLALTHDSEGRTSSYMPDKDLAKWENSAFSNINI